MTHRPLRCSRCGDTRPDSDRFCGACGAELVDPSSDAPEVKHHPVIGPWLVRSRTLSVSRIGGGAVGSFKIHEGENLLGRAVDAMLAEDNLLSERHAMVTLRAGAVTVRDLDSRNGVFTRIEPGECVDLRDGDRVIVGKNVFRFEAARAGATSGTLHVIAHCDAARDRFPCALPPNGLALGQEGADLPFTHDPLVSPEHCHIAPRGAFATIVDHGSAHGTFVTRRGEFPFDERGVLLLGQRVFRLDP